MVEELEVEGKWIRLPLRQQLKRLEKRQFDHEYSLS